MRIPRPPRTARPLLALVLLASVLVAVPVPAVALVPDVRIDSAPIALESAEPVSGPLAPPGALDEVATNSPAGVRQRSGLAGTPDRLRAAQEDVRPFRLIGITVDGDPGEGPGATGLVRVRSKGTWGAWLPLDLHGEEGPDEGSIEALAAERRGGQHAGAPVWVGEADAFELNLPAGVTSATVHLARDGERKVKVRLDEPRSGASTGQPPIASRASWGARAAKEITYSPLLQLGIVHHSVSANAYTAADVPAILRTIQAYHMDTNGWSDIAYNFAVDRFGGMWEARAGGITETVWGGHAKGFNRNTVGVVMLGDFSAAAPTPASIDAVGRLLGWKLAFHGVDPAGSTAYRSGGNERFPAGTSVTVSNVIGHRDTGFTDCPGTLAYSQLGTIRSTAIGTARTNGIRRFWQQTPTVARNADGRLEVFAVDATGAMAHTWQRTAGGTWGPWRSLGSARFIGPPSVVSNTDGRLEVFAVADDDAIWHNWQVSPNGSWSGWFRLGGTWWDNGAAVSTRNADGRLEVFARGMDKALYHAWQQWPGGPWTDWFSLGGSFTGDPAIGIAPDGRVEVFGRSSTNALMHSWQTPGTATGWSPWTNRGGNITGDPQIGTNADGRLEVFATAGGGVAHIWQVTPGGGWSGWLPLFGGSLPAGRKPLVTRNADGRLEVFGVDAGGSLIHVWQKVPNGDWPTTWFRLAGQMRPNLAYGVNADARMELFYLSDPDHDARHLWQTPGSPSGWSGTWPLP